MSITVKIGTWHETGERQITRCPSYYAADTETLALKPGDYDARLSFEGGYTIPMPYWLLIGIDAERVEGRLYSGFGGCNFSSTDLPKGERVTYTVQKYSYQIADAVNAGRLTLAPGFEWLMGGASDPVWKHQDAPKTWDEVRRLAA